MTYREISLETLEEFLPNDVLEEEARRCIETLLPTPGDIGVVPKLLAMSLVGDPEEPVDIEYCVDFFVLDTDDFNDVEGRRGLLRQLGRDCADRGVKVIVIFLITEAWLSHQPVGEPRKYQQAGDDPDRREVALIAGQTLDKRTMFAHAEITRNRLNRVKSVDKPAVTFDFKREGLFQSALMDVFWKSYVSTLAAKLKWQRPSGRTH
jgi:hypothetical protein